MGGKGAVLCTRTWQDVIEARGTGMLAQSPQQRQQAQQAIREQISFTTCGHVGVGLMRCSACK